MNVVSSLNQPYCVRSMFPAIFHIILPLDSLSQFRRRGGKRGYDRQMPFS